MTKILFQGDSLTDACRDKEGKDPLKRLGVRVCKYGGSLYDKY